MLSSFVVIVVQKKIKILLVREKIVIWWIGRSLGICVLVLFVAFRGTSNESPGMSAISLAVAFVVSSSWFLVSRHAGASVT